jgi:hypothetical protein
MVLRGRVQSTGRETPYVHCGTHKRIGEEVGQSFLPEWVEIEEGVEGGYMLVTVDAKGWSFIETWHPTVEEAKEEAKLHFSISEDAWEPITRDE